MYKSETEKWKLGFYFLYIVVFPYYICITYAA